MLVEVDPVGLVRGGQRATALDQHVNDRPDVASSFTSVALGLEALERFVRREPLRRVHECVFGMLALESEPVDPRL
jgi:hypothetical protein